MTGDKKRLCWPRASEAERVEAIAQAQRALRVMVPLMDHPDGDVVRSAAKAVDAQHRIIGGLRSVGPQAERGQLADRGESPTPGRDD